MGNRMKRPARSEHIFTRNWPNSNKAADTQTVVSFYCAAVLGKRASSCAEELARYAKRFSAFRSTKRPDFCNPPRIMKTITLQLKNSVNRSHVRLAFLLIPLACFALSPQAGATCQEGCLTNQSTVLGDDALLNNVGVNNTAVGWSALEFNTTGFANTATGAGALQFSTSGDANTATGTSALFFNATGNNNTAFGRSALEHNTTGTHNIGLGVGAGFNLTTGDNNIDIANPGHADESSTIRIGKAEIHTATFIAGIAGATVPTGVAVIINANGHLGTATSSARYKEEIKPMESASEAILALNPVTFRYKHELDPAGIPQFGLVAEEVEKVNPDLVARDEQGKPYTVRYDAVNAMLLNEFLKEHKAFLEEHRTVEELKKQVGALTAGLQKVSTELEASNSALQTVLNDQ
jgi:Chaperone of endosialidase